MKMILSAFIFLFSIASPAGANRYDDGSYYNDDYIHEEEMVNDVKVSEPSDTYTPEAVEAPKKVVPIKKKRRKPAGGFQEVQSGGRVKGFRNITNDRLDPDYYQSSESLGSH